MKRALIITAIVAAYAGGFMFGLKRGESKPPTICSFQGYYVSATFAGVVGMLARRHKTELCVRYGDALHCEAMVPDVGEAFRRAGMPE